MVHSKYCNVPVKALGDGCAPELRPARGTLPRANIKPATRDMSAARVMADVYLLNHGKNLKTVLSVYKQNAEAFVMGLAFSLEPPRLKSGFHMYVCYRSWLQMCET